MISHAVVIAGAGPTGLMLAGELALSGVDVAIVERRTNQDLVGMRAGGLHARTIEILDQRGIAERFLAEGKTAQVTGFAWNSLDISDFPSRHPYVLALWQAHIERILAGWVAELPVTFYRGREVTAIAQDDTGVDVTLADGESLRATYLVGCDGGRSVVRKAAGIEFAGWDPTVSCLIAEVELAGDRGAEPPWGLRRNALGINSIARIEDSLGVRVLVTEQNPNAGAAGEPTLQTLSAALIAVYGTDYGVHSPTSIGRFTDMTRQAASYRERRILLAGDSAHVHNPVGGQGLNIGVQDAVNLGWKLAQVVKQTSPDSLLDTYHAERHPIGALVLRNTMAQVALIYRFDDRNEALREVFAELLRMDEPRKRIGGVMSGLELRYDFGEGHPLLGRRMPDLDLITPAGPCRTFTFLHGARPLLLDLGAPVAPGSVQWAFDITPWGDRVRLVRATYAGAWELPVVGVVAASSAVLIRPDGYVAWVGKMTDASLVDALTKWFGSPAA